MSRLMLAAMSSTLTMVPVILGTMWGVRELTGNVPASWYFGFAAGWFAYQVVFLLTYIAYPLKSNEK